ncbi:hypothetical protein XU06_29325 (plasmid) [Rhodococcus erythropolis]|uniref:alpha/beta fold hydrolase n=1 Tax=Rhodococcus erythropolis TaxID=1833 RepID=UPI00061B5F77|nr:alpha/beta fold hydrolase [Rhodococcus erythropolis]AKE01085.1 hypothetical protein XU06_29325 [Rhodococcus erythropolis]
MFYELANDAVLRFGTGRPVVLLGALGSARSIWDSTANALHELAVSTIAMDLRGHGDSPAPRGPYTVAALAADVLSTLDRLDVPHVDLAGLSLGGAVAQQIAISAPERVASLTLLSTSSRFGNYEAWTERALLVRESGTASLAEGLQGKWITHEYARRFPATLDRLIQMIQDTDREGYAGCAEALAQWDSTNHLSEIKAPTLVLGGVNDPSTDPESLALLASRIPEARHVVIEPGAHLLPVERPVLVATLIAEHALTPSAYVSEPGK